MKKGGNKFVRTSISNPTTPTSKGNRPLYRVDVESNSEANVTLLPPPGNYDNSTQPGKPVSKAMWEDERVIKSPSKKNKTTSIIPLSYNGKRQMLAIPTATFSVDQMTVTTRSPGKDKPTGWFEDEEVSGFCCFLLLWLLFVSRGDQDGVSNIKLVAEKLDERERAAFRVIVAE